MTTFKDVFKDSFLEAFSATNVSLSSVGMCLFLAAVMGAYLFFLYQLVTRKSFYDKTFNMSIPVLAVIVCAIVLTIQFNIVVSLGMVGALSIVRFRTAVKSPMDLVFLFWAIAVGIICGANIPIIAVAMSAVITAGLFVMELLPVAKAPVLLIVNASQRDAKDQILQILAKNTRLYHIKSQSIDSDRVNMIIEVRSKNPDVILDQVASIESVSRCSLVSHDGEVTF